MQWKGVTGLVLVGGVLAWCLYDIIAYAFGGNPATISRLFLRISQRTLAFAFGVVFVLGVFIGHVFLPQRPTKDEDEDEAGPPNPPAAA